MVTGGCFWEQQTRGKEFVGRIKEVWCWCATAEIWEPKILGWGFWSNKKVGW